MLTPFALRTQYVSLYLTTSSEVPSLITHFYTEDLFDDSSDQSSCDGAPAFSDIEALALIHGDGVVCLTDHLDVVSWHSHLVRWVFGSFWPVEGNSFV